MAEPSEGADLSRSDALQGTTAEAAKASFKAHHAATAEQLESPTSSPVSETAPSSLATIQDIRSTLDKLSADFSFPSSLEFTDNEEDGLAYSPANAPVRLYEHALDDLLVQLDAVESDGDGEVRELRRATVKKVEKAIEDIERRVKEAREVTKDGAEVATAAFGSAVDVSQDYDMVAESESPVETKPQEGGPPPPKSDGRSAASCSSPVPLSAPDSEVASPHDTTSAEAAFTVFVSLPEAITAPTPSPTSEVDISCVCTNDVSESTREMVTEQATSAPSEISSSAIPAEPPTEFATPVLGAIAPLSTPVSPARSSSVLLEPEDLSTYLSLDPHSAPLRLEGDDDEWTEVEA
jgi:hypothetical protein